jgi:uncharacterized protein (TIGR02453 family)
MDDNAAVIFEGIPAAAVEFYAGLEAENTKVWWTAHKSDYELFVRGPMEALAAALASEFGEGKLFRPYRDVRFSRDKTPYKTQQGLLVARPCGAGFYARVDSTGLGVGGGFLAHGPGQTAGFRSGVEADGGALASIVAGLERAGFTVGGETLVTAPRGYRADHPHLPLLRHKEIIVMADLGTPDWLDTPAAAEQVASWWRRLGPFVDWLDAHVPPPPQREGRRR